MKITIEGSSVTLFTPGVDAQGKPTFGPDGVTPLGSTRHMTLEQYERHARDPAFVAAVAPADHALVVKAIADAKASGA